MSPSRSAAVKAGIADYLQPGDAAQDGDLLSTVEAVAAVLVVVRQVLDHEFQEALAAGHLVQVLPMLRQLGLLSA